MLYQEPRIEYDNDGSIRFEDSTINPQIRTLGELKEVLYDKEFFASSDPMRPVYYMYRDLKRQMDFKLFENAQLRFDLTIIDPLYLGVERNKTLGHYHKPGLNGSSSPELYEVVEGEAHMLLQLVEEGNLREVVLIKARRGDIVLIRSGYWHLTINGNDKMLVMTNLISKDVEVDYDAIKKYGGGAYFELFSGELVANRNYGSIPFIKYVKPEQTFDRFSDEALYLQFVQEPSMFDFLTNSDR